MFIKRIKALAAAGVFGAITLTSGPTPARAEESHEFKPVLNVGGIDDANGGTIKGTVKFAGKQANRKPIPTTSDNYCDKAHKSSPLLDEKFVFGDKIGDDATLQNVFVYICKGLEAGKTHGAPINKAEIDQVGCRYTPHVQGIVVGQELKILNGDETLHNVKVNSKNNGNFNEGMPSKGMVLTKKFAKVEMPVEFKCDVHSWMSAYVLAIEHPFYAVTQQDGTFTIKGLPPGKYEVAVWHEFPKFSPDKKTIEVTVEAGKTVENADFTFKPPAAKN